VISVGVRALNRDLGDLERQAAERTEGAGRDHPGATDLGLTRLGLLVLVGEERRGPTLRPAAAGTIAPFGAIGRGAEDEATAPTRRARAVVGGEQPLTEEAAGV